LAACRGITTKRFVRLAVQQIDLSRRVPMR
jgi:hypothetical protein